MSSKLAEVALCAFLGGGEIILGCFSFGSFGTARVAPGLLEELEAEVSLCWLCVGGGGTILGKGEAGLGTAVFTQSLW